MTYLALSVPGYTVTAPGGIPTGGLHDAAGGAGIIKTGISLLLVVVSILSFFYLIFGGFKWMTSNGDQEKLAGARLTLIYAIGGLVLSFVSFGIITFAGSFFGVNLLSF